MTGLPIKYLWQWQVGCEPHQAWTLIADEFKLCHALGLCVPEEDEKETKSSAKEETDYLFRLIQTSLPLAHPPEFTWIQDHELTATFKFYSTLVQQMTLRIKLTPNDKGTLLQHYLSVYPHSMVGRLSVPLLVGRGIRLHLKETYAKITAHIKENSDQGFFDTVSHLKRGSDAQVRASVDRLVEEGFRETWVKQLISTLAYESDNRVKMIEPIGFAHSHGVPMRRVIDMFISAVSEQLLSFQWRLRCPRCMEARYMKPHLKELPTTGHCSSCDVHFKACLSKNIELAFQPHPSIRTIRTKKADAVDPLARSNEFVRMVVEPGGARQLDLDIPPGKYRIRTGHTGPNQWYLLETTAGKQSRVQVLIFDERIEVTSAQSTGTHVVKVQSNSSHPQTLIIENLVVQAEALQATRVVTNQHFRNLFPGETVNEEAPVALGDLALLAADVISSTEVLGRMGDEKAYRLIREFYSFIDKSICLHDGAIITGAGDCVLAAFVNPVKAVKAVLKLRETMDSFNATLPEDDRLRVRLSLHYGPCLAMNISQVLDFFGYHVKIASSMQQFSAEDDVVISEQMWHIPEVRHLIEGSANTVTPFTVDMPAWGGETPLYRLRPLRTASPAMDEAVGAQHHSPLGSGAGRKLAEVDSAHQNQGEN